MAPPPPLEVTRRLLPAPSQRRVRQGQPTMLQHSATQHPAAVHPAVRVLDMPCIGLSSSTCHASCTALSSSRCRSSASAMAGIHDAPDSFLVHGVMQILQSRQMAQWVKWAQSTNQAMAATPSVSAFGALVPCPDQASAALPSPRQHTTELADLLSQVRRRQQTSRRWCPQHTHSKRRPSTSRSHERSGNWRQHGARV